MKIDVQSFDKKLEYFLKALQNSEISERNKEIILDFDKDGVIKGMEKDQAKENIEYPERYLILKELF